MGQMAGARVAYNGFEFFAGVVSGKGLLRTARVSRRDADPEAGFNRRLSVPRVREIARYLDAEQSAIPTNIVVSAQPEARLRFSAKSGVLRWDEDPSAFLVLDGQHRLYSMHYTDRDYPFAVAIFHGLSQAQEVQLFIDINTKQKGVPTALLLDIKRLAGTETSAEQQLRALFDAAANDVESPLRGAMSPSAKKSGQISRTAWNAALKRVIDAGPLTQVADDDDRARLVINYLQAADRIIRQSGAVNNNLTKATILQAFFEVFNEVVDTTLARDGVLRPDNFAETLEPVAALNFDDYIGSNRPSKAKLVSDMRAQLSDAPVVTSEML